MTRIRTQMVDEVYVLKGLADMGYSLDSRNVKKEGDSIRIRTGLLRPDIVLNRQGGQAYGVTMNDLLAVRGRGIREFLQQLGQRYAYHAAIDKLQEQGFSLVSEEVEQGERIHLVMRRTA